MLGASQAVALSRLGFIPQSYGAAIVALNPISYWRLGEAGGAAIVDERAVQNGTYAGTIEYSVAPIVQRSTGRAIGFNGTDAYGQIPDNPDKFALASYTIDFAFQADAATRAGREHGAPVEGPVSIATGRRIVDRAFQRCRPAEAQGLCRRPERGPGLDRRPQRGGRYPAQQELQSGGHRRRRGRQTLPRRRPKSVRGQHARLAEQSRTDHSRGVLGRRGRQVPRRARRRRPLRPGADRGGNLDARRQPDDPAPVVVFGQPHCAPGGLYPRRDPGDRAPGLAGGADPKSDHRPRRQSVRLRPPQLEGHPQ